MTDVRDDLFLAHRDALFGLAYRMLGSVTDAEDVVSEAYLRWCRVTRAGADGAQAADARINDARAYLFAVTARLSIDQLRSARRTRVTYVGTWLPEPLVTDWTVDPVLHVATKDTLSLGLMRVLEQLSPAERAVFILREAFDFPHDETGRLLEISAATVRQHYRRARQRLAADRAPRFTASREKQDELMHRFMAAVGSGEVQPLADLLVTDAVLYADGGGKASSIRRPAFGHLRVARFIRGLARHAPTGMRVDLVRANGAPAMLVRTATDVLGIYAIEVDEESDHIRAVHAVRNPDKLRRL